MATPVHPWRAVDAYREEESADGGQADVGGFGHPLLEEMGCVAQAAVDHVRRDVVDPHSECAAVRVGVVGLSERLVEHRFVVGGEGSGFAGVVGDQSRGHGEPAAYGRAQLCRFVLGIPVAPGVIQIVGAGEAGEDAAESVAGLFHCPAGGLLGQGEVGGERGGPPPVHRAHVVQAESAGLGGEGAAEPDASEGRVHRDRCGEVSRVQAHHWHVAPIQLRDHFVRRHIVQACDDENRRPTPGHQSESPC